MELLECFDQSFKPKGLPMFISCFYNNACTDLWYILRLLSFRCSKLSSFSQSFLFPSPQRSGFSVKRFIIIGFVLKKTEKKGKCLRVREEKMMEGSSKKKTKPDPFTDTVFSWSVEDIFNEDLFKDKVFDSTFTNKNLNFLFLLRKVVSLCDYVPLSSFWLFYIFA